MDWHEELAEVVTSHYARTGKAFLLANATRELQRRGVDLQSALFGRKLKDAIVEEAPSSLRLVRNPAHSLVWGVMPSKAPEPGDLETLFTGSATKSSDSIQSPRFGRGVWLAFAKPIKSGYRRYLEIGPPSRPSDIPEGSMPPPEGVEIDASFIYNPASDLVQNDHSASVEKNIRDWAESKSIKIENLLFSGRKIYTENVGRVVDYDFLDFSGLSTPDKARILIPLDILPKIRFGR